MIFADDYKALTVEILEISKLMNETIFSEKFVGPEFVDETTQSWLQSFDLFESVGKKHLSQFSFVKI